MKAALLVAEGFEEAETVIIYDILNRLKIDVDLIACGDDGQLKTEAYFALSVDADHHLNDVSATLYDALIIPGGPAATQRLSQLPAVIDFIQLHDNANKWLCALCSAPARVLGNNHLLKGRKYTCSGDLWQTCPDGIYSGENVVIDGNLISGKGLGMAFEFAFTVAEKMTGTALPGKEMAEHIYVDLPDR